MLHSLNQLQKHTRRVLITKRSLPVFAFLLITFMIIWPTLQKQKENFSIPTSTKDKSVQMDMENIRFFGLNNKKLPMTLTTPKGKEIDSSKHILKLEKPVATYQMNTKEILTGKTPYALVDQNSEQVFFESDLHITTSSKYTIITSKVLCDYTQGTSDTDQPISIKGPAGILNAKGAWMGDKGNLILLKKQVEATLYQKEHVKISSPEGAQIDQIKKTITTLGKATILHQGNTLKADKMVAYYTDEKQIEKVIATGNVSAGNSKQTITGEEGIYYPETKMVTMKKNVTLSQGKNVLKGDKAILNLITGENDLTAKKRVTGQLIPDQFERKKK